jgi:arginyl-tRNA synthetase
MILYVVDNGQTLHFEQLFKSAKALGYVKNEKLEHVKFGLILSDDLKKMSTRAGKHIPLEDLICESVERARKIVERKNPVLSKKDKEKIAKAVGVGAVKYNDLSQNRISDIAFNWDKMLNFEGNSAPYLQYTYARLKSILRKGGIIRSKFDAGQLREKIELDLILETMEFPDVIKKIETTHYPHYLSDYLYKLAKSVNNFYQTTPVLKADKETRSARLALILTASDILKTGLTLLGIKTLEKI